MITSKQDYLDYLEADRVALNKGKYTFISWLMDDIWNFQRLLRKVEYLQNCKRGGGTLYCEKSRISGFIGLR